MTDEKRRFGIIPEPTPKMAIPLKLSELYKLAVTLLLSILLCACGGGGGGGSGSGDNNNNNDSQPPAAEEPFDSSNNNDFSDADKVTSTGSYDGSVNELVDIFDYFDFTAPASGNYQINLKWNSPAQSIELAIYDSNETLLATDTAPNNKSVAIDNLALNNGQQIYITVTAINTNSSDTGYRLVITKLADAPPPDSDNNGTTASAVSINTNGNHNGTINCASDVNDYFLFTAPENGDYEFSLAWPSSDDLDLVVTDLTDTIIGSAMLDNDNPAVVNEIALTTGNQLYIRIQCIADPPNDINYTLTIASSSGAPPPVSSDPSNNGSTSNATPFAGTGSVSGFVDDAADTSDYYSFTADTTANYHIELLWGSDIHDLDIIVLNEQDVVIHSSERALNDHEWVDDIALMNGEKIFVAVRAFYTAGETIEYKLSINEQ